MKRLLAVLGDDVSASLSPRLHESAADACGLDIVYLAFNCVDERHFRASVEAMRSLGALGCNVTIPYKRTAFSLCDDLTAIAEQIGVVNTLFFDAAGVRGDNTDGPALLHLLRELPPGAQERIQILGAGGACRAAAWAAGQLTDDLHVCARRPDQAAELEGFGALAHPLSPVKGATLVISGLPGRADLAQQSMRDWVAGDPIIFDMAYGGVGESSPLTQAAEAVGLVAFDGKKMLVEQAALSLSAWTGGEVSCIRSAMRASVL